jgi:uncharacterized membrane protein YgdD (TMEM256/DUF423 family)
MDVKNWFTIGAIFVGLAVVAGAFGAHVLRARIDTYSMEIYEKAVLYQFVHAFGILIVASLGLARVFTSQDIQPVAALFSLGIVFFSGSLYGLALSGIRTLGAITPIGGVCFIIAWGLLAWKSSRLPPEL